jgi:hypothetical protein
MLRTSIVPTIIKGGFRENVIPADAEATLDVRALWNCDCSRHRGGHLSRLAGLSILLNFVDRFKGNWGPWDHVKPRHLRS